MKTMTCKQLGGACDEKFTADTFDNIAEMSRTHGMKMFQKGDQAHIDAMNKMQNIMQSQEGITKWMNTKRQVFNALPISV